MSPCSRTDTLRVRLGPAVSRILGPGRPLKRRGQGSLEKLAGSERRLPTEGTSFCTLSVSAGMPVWPRPVSVRSPDDAGGVCKRHGLRTACSIPIQTMGTPCQSFARAWMLRNVRSVPLETEKYWYASSAPTLLADLLGKPFVKQDSFRIRENHITEIRRSANTRSIRISSKRMVHSNGHNCPMNIP